MFKRSYLGVLLCCLLPSGALAAVAPVIPGSADTARVTSLDKPPLFKHDADAAITIPETAALTPAPDAAKTIHFTLQHVTIEGAKAFSPAQLEDIYAGYIGKDVTLDVAWKIAAAITERYHGAGYFLSRAFVPAQSIKNGEIIIKVIEGYIGEVELKDDKAKNRVAQKYIEQIKAIQPIKAAEIESFLLRLNDLPGLSFRAVLSPDENKDMANSGAVKLSLIASDKAGRGTLSYDNFGSRFLGPNEISATYQLSLLPLQSTTVSGLVSAPTNELKYGTLSHDIIVFPDTTLNFSGAVAHAQPGYSLRKYDIDGDSKSLGISFEYQMIRQRDQDLSFKLALDGRNTDNTFAATPLTHDRVRALRASVNFDNTDRWAGLTSGTFTLSHGLKLFGASDKGDLNLSRADAVPDFTKGELYLSRLQGLGSHFVLSTSATGQMSSTALFSSEEFGYGGQAFGRAYDNSEITGENGLAGSAELRYNDLGVLPEISPVPYVFYDIGKAWDRGSIGLPASSVSGASAGFGVRMTTDFHLSGNLGLAFPLTKPIANPIYGYENGRNPRITLQVLQEF